MTNKRVQYTNECSREMNKIRESENGCLNSQNISQLQQENIDELVINRHTPNRYSIDKTKTQKKLTQVERVSMTI